MITTHPDGTPHAVRVGVALVDRHIWTSGTLDRVCTRHLRRDPRATLMLWDQGYGYLTLEGRVDILEGPEIPDQSIRLFRVMQGKAVGDRLLWNGEEKDDDEFRRIMVRERRVIYELTPGRIYGID